jgi:phosphodiesterase/alkaline phosphatase D-like protein
MPSNPPGWSAGKWGEWYPDVLNAQRQLTTAQPKPYWQSGWLAQHDRLMRAISARRRGVPLVVAGDMHATAAGTIQRSGRLDLRRNPVHVTLSGTLGSRGAGFPSGLRGTPPRPPAHLDIDEQIAPLEENGFLIADVTQERIVLRFFRWNSTRQSEADIDRLEPFRTLELEPA